MSSTAMTQSISRVPASTPGQLRSFGTTGLINTTADFLLMNVAFLVIGLPLVLANIISTSIAMMLSYLLNNRWVFTGTSVGLAQRVVLFVLVTMFGLFGIQTVVIHVLTESVLWPGNLAQAFNLYLNLGLSDDFTRANTAKLIASIFTLGWNFAMYKYVVFKR